MEEWKEYKISDVCKIRHGFAFKGAYFTNEKQPYICVTPGNFDIKGGFKLSKPKYYHGPIPNDYILNKDDLIVTMTDLSKDGDTLGYSAIIPQIRDITFLHNQRIGLVESIASNISKHFLYWVMRTPEYQKYIVNCCSGSTVKHTSPKLIGTYVFKAPDPETQEEIASLLNNLDAKIELNRRINDNLEQQAQALFKSWFVDFEPFKKGKFIDSELGMIPEGWQVEELGNITNSITEKVGKRTDIKVLSPVNTGDLLLSEEYFTKQVYSKNLAKYIIVEPNDFAYNPARINIGSIGMNTFDFSGCVSPVYVVFRCEKEYHHFFNIFKATKNFKEEVNTRAIGGVRQTLSYKDFSLIKIVYPPKEAVERFNKIYSHIMTLIKKNVLENKRLHQTRDTLLPKLMSGELKINDINN